MTVACKQFACLFLVTSLLISLFFLAGGIKFVLLQISTIHKANVCLTEECQRSAELLQRSMNFSIDPCEDFYEYTCGQLISAGGSNEFKVSPQVEATKHVIIDSLHILNSNASDFVTNQLKIFYGSCMEANKQTWANWTAKFIDELGGWSPSEPADAFDWIELATRMSSKGFGQNYFVNVEVMSDLMNRSRPVLLIDEVDKRPVDIFEQDLKKLLARVRINITSEQVVELQDFNRKLQSAKTDLMLSLYTNKTTLNKLENEIPGLQVTRLVQKILDNPKIKPDQEVVVPDKRYLREMSKLIDASPKRTVKGYMMAKLVEQQFEFYPNYTSLSEHMVGCFGHLQENLGLSLGAAYVRYKMTPEDRESGRELVGFLRQEVERMIENASWMSRASKTRASAKLHTIISNVAYLDMMLSDDAMENHFAGLTLRPGEFYRNILRIQKFINDKQNAQINQQTYTIDKTIQTFWQATQVNAFYHLQDNFIIILPAFMQGRFFQRDRPRYMNFGSLGSIIGHEFTHGFDMEGRNFDKFSNWNPWMDEQTANKFQSQANCFVEQYDGLPIEGTEQTVNGTRTLSENIADNGGFGAAIRAYSEWVGRNGPELELPGINLRPSQLIWVSLASVWCDDASPDELAKKAADDTHSPDKIRVNVALSNQKEFSRAFNCSIGSSMNPEHKCKLW